MKKFLLLHYGFEKISQEEMDEWTHWFDTIADRQVERGHLPLGVEITREGVTDLPFSADSITGYTIMTADDLDEAREIASGCPIILSTRVYEIS